MNDGYDYTFDCCPFVQELMTEAEKTPNVVKVCNRKGLYEQLDDLQKRY